MGFKTIPLEFIVVIYLLAINRADGTIGMNWGRDTRQRLLPSNVVDLMLQNGIREARLFTTEEDLVRAFTWSGIGLTITISNPAHINNDISSSFWVKARLPFFKSSSIRQVYVADFVFANGIKNKALIHDALQAMTCLQNAIKNVGYGDQIKVTIPHSVGVLKNTTGLRPSEAEFVDEIKPEMMMFLSMIQNNNASFVISMNPIYDVQRLNLDLNFAIPDNKTTFIVKDKNRAVYTNTVELVYDSFFWALAKLNASDVKIVVGQVGWPTDGYPGANTTMAERFYKGLLPWVTSNRGTPARPGAAIDVYLHAITDENKMFINKEISFMRHFGIYRSNGTPKYKLDLSGKGQDIYPATAKAIQLMPRRWCVFNEHQSDLYKVQQEMEKACQDADCSALAKGASCGQLSFNQNISYQFNMYYQFYYQNDTFCDFDGLGKVTTEDPSVPGCLFPVEVVKNKEPTYAFTSAGKRADEKSCVFLLLLLILMGLL